MLVSVIISSHNYGQYLRQAIDSALNQSHPDIQVVVVDDASTDGSREILDEYDNIDTCLLSRNSGQICAVNEGFRLARGEIVIFLDADDVLTPDAVSLHLDRLSANPAASKCQGYLQVIDHDGNPGKTTIPRKLFPPGDYKALTLERGIGALPHSFTSGNAWPRWFLEQVMPFPKELEDSAPDGCLNAVSTLYGPTEVVEDVVGQYRIHGDNRSRKRFEAESLENALCRSAEMRDYLAATAGKLGYTVNLARWNRRMRSWRDQIVARAVFLINGQVASPRFRDFVMAPFVSGRTNAPKALALSATLCVVWFLPKPLALRVIARLLGYRTMDDTLIAPTQSDFVLPAPRSREKSQKQHGTFGK